MPAPAIFFFFEASGDPRDPLSFPTRRSPVLAAGAAARADARAAPRASPMRREFLVNRNLLGVDRDLAARGEVLDRPSHHLASAPASRADAVLCPTLTHPARPLLPDPVLVDEL